MERYAQHGGTVMSFCKSEGVGDKAFYYWRKRLERDDTEQPKEVAFVEVAPPADDSALELVVGEYVVRMRGAVDTEYLERVLAVLAERR